MNVLDFYLERIWRTSKWTSGVLYCNAAGPIQPICYTLEDIDRDSNMDGDLTDPGETKVVGDTCIPAGTYKMELFKSPSFGRILPKLLNVPGFDGILIHRGNTTEHTKGCIIVGSMSSITEQKVYQSEQSETLILNLMKTSTEYSIKIFYNQFLKPQS